MSQYYGESQWLDQAGPSQSSGWNHQTPPPPPARSGASSAIPREREEPTAFSQQLEEVDRAIDNLVKSGKMFGGNGPRREFVPTLPQRQHQQHQQQHQHRRATPSMGRRGGRGRLYG